MQHAWIEIERKTISLFGRVREKGLTKDTQTHSYYHRITFEGFRTSFGSLFHRQIPHFSSRLCHIKIVGEEMEPVLLKTARKNFQDIYLRLNRWLVVVCAGDVSLRAELVRTK